MGVTEMRGLSGCLLGLGVEAPMLGLELALVLLLGLALALVLLR